MKKARIFALCTALALTLPIFSQTAVKKGFAENCDIKISVDLNGSRKSISPYIYGVNSQFATDEYLYDATAGSARQGGNRFSGYNWETNFSNAGRDWNHNSDRYLINFDASLLSTPGAPAIGFANEAFEKNVAYKITTIQMAGYVAADDSGEVSESEIAPSSRWVEVKASKGAEFTLEPDKTDGYVYMDEYVNYLVQTLGDSTTPTGYQAYSLDNEPSLWASTHSRMHPNAVTCQEIITKTTDYALAIKSVDPNADVFGPALFGVNAYTTFSSASDWSDHSADYDWFISYYLDEMKKAEQSCGKRLVDVIDVHYYSEAKGQCRVTECEDYSHTDCIEARLQSTRTLFDGEYIESSWIGDYEQEYLPILPNIQKSIDTYYPGTKIALTEYNFGGGNHISGAVAQADALGIFAQNDVFCANLWAINSSFEYQLAAIDLYTNYDGNGASFGDTLVPSSTSDAVKSTSYAAISGSDESKVNIVVTNKDLTETQSSAVSIDSSTVYKSAKVYGITGDSSEIKLLQTVNNIQNNSFTVDVPALSVVQIEVNCDDYTMLGDVNTDNIVNNSDILALKQYLHAISEASAFCDESDLVADNKINTVDLIALNRKITKWNTPDDKELLAAFWSTKSGQWRIKNGMSAKTITCVFTGESGNGLNLAYGYWDTAAVNPDTGTAGRWFNNDDTKLGVHKFDESGRAYVTFTVPENCVSLEMIIFNYVSYDASGNTTQLDKSAVGLEKVIINS